MKNRGSTSILTNLVGDHPRNIHTKFEANPCSGLRGEVEKLKSSRRQQRQRRQRQRRRRRRTQPDRYSHTHSLSVTKKAFFYLYACLCCLTIHFTMRLNLVYFSFRVHTEFSYKNSRTFHDFFSLFFKDIHSFFYDFNEMKAKTFR